MITSISIKNYRSIVDAKISLAPFTLLIGANGTGKSNFLKLLEQVSRNSLDSLNTERHVNHARENQEIVFENDAGKTWEIRYDRSLVAPQDRIRELRGVSVFSLDPNFVGQAEDVAPNPVINSNGSGTVRMLDALKTGDREDLFDKIEETLKKYIPEVEKLSFSLHAKGKQLQVREKHLNKPILASELSEGTKFVLAILTILYQENPPSLICLEEIDRGLHPRLLEKIVRLCFDLTRLKDMPQIIATTHNPYLVDQFKDEEDAVVVVEKEEGQTQFFSLKERLERFEGIEDQPLGEMWFSGYLGGVPGK